MSRKYIKKGYAKRYGTDNVATRPEVRLKMRLAKLGKLPWNKGIKTGITPWKGKKRPNVSGSNHHNWRGGVTTINHKLRTSLEYKIWRTAVFTRDNYTCVWCGIKGNQTGGYLEADHIKPWAQYPELRFAIDNGRTLCKKCHRTTETYGTKGRTRL